MADVRLLLAVAHPDDETFGCGSLLAHAAAAGAEITVVCATRGEAGAPAEGSGVDLEALPSVREAELRSAAGLLGVTTVQVFDWLDSGMDGEPGPGTLCSADVDHVAAVIADAIDAFRPTIVVTLDASDGHRDHARVRDATLVAVERSTWPVPRVYLHCLPQELMRAWAEIIRANTPESAYLMVRELGTPHERITTVIDTTDLLDLREEAIALHVSQTPPFDVMPIDLRRAFLTAERLQRVVPPWTGGSVETSLFDSEDRSVPESGPES